jgi:hypothetical protein
MPAAGDPNAAASPGPLMAILMVVMNSGPKNFLLFRWDEAAGSGR